MHSGTEPDGRDRRTPPPNPGHRRRVVAGGSGGSAGVPPPDPLTDTAPTGGLHTFDLGMVPASVTPPRTWRHAAWFAITTSAAALGGVVLAGSLLVNSPVRLDGLDLPSIPRGDYPPPVPRPPRPQPQPHRTVDPLPQHLLSTPTGMTPVGETRPLTGPSAGAPAHHPRPTPAPELSPPPDRPTPPEETPVEPAPPWDIELPGFPGRPQPVPPFPPDTPPPLFGAPPPALSPDEDHQTLFSGELPTGAAPPDQPSSPADGCAEPDVPTSGAETAIPPTSEASGAAEDDDTGNGFGAGVPADRSCAAN